MKNLKVKSVEFFNKKNLHIKDWDFETPVNLDSQQYNMVTPIEGYAWARVTDDKGMEVILNNNAIPYLQ